MKKIIGSTILIASLVGCGGSDGDGKNALVNYQSNGSGFSDITDGFDITVHLYNLLDEDKIEKDHATITFDINNNSTFDDGDIRIKVGNTSGIPNVYYETGWTVGDFIVEYNKAGTILSVRPNSGVIVGGSNILTNDIGSVSYRLTTFNDTFVSNHLIFRINRAFTSSDADAPLVKQSLNKISSATPFNIEFSDGVSSADYIPGKDVFSQGTFTDSKDDYTGNNNQVDLKSINISNI
ncbi:hypothetical protein SBX64_10870 [Vibrio rhizosphaerae]|uniref:Lipoprotein n=1 Tax=Vibrio rhizosphaerae TaxID=398736 RepID=A0ABU4IVY7_9VIBR|nr:hypothetical protein [Vibrio rhizosphaerae]MDW6093053.1 hypothetical protein [Vibrio rhizosphaerae]